MQYIIRLGEVSELAFFPVTLPKGRSSWRWNLTSRRIRYLGALYNQFRMNPLLLSFYPSQEMIFFYVTCRDGSFSGTNQGGKKLYLYFNQTWSTSVRRPRPDTCLVGGFVILIEIVRLGFILMSMVVISWTSTVCKTAVKDRSNSITDDCTFNMSTRKRMILHHKTRIVSKIYINKSIYSKM